MSLQVGVFVKRNIRGLKAVKLLCRCVFRALSGKKTFSFRLKGSAFLGGGLPYQSNRCLRE
jgi:hypothetical protein